ncbi:MAG: hypothetical protein J2P27_11710 [Actinobacteria bacterium]|nr:hypothetical protein [Actinomycetota bacterium]
MTAAPDDNAETLARLADRDTSDIKASHAAIMRSMEALRETQIEQGQVLADHTDQLTELRRGLGVVRDGVTTIIGLLGGHGQAG